jgi:hypothetical protein
MADHVRKQVRDAAKTALTGLSGVGSNVFSGRVAPLKPSECPAILIYLNVDQGEHGASNGGATSEFDGTLRLEAVRVATDTVLDDLDAMAALIEQTLFANAAFLATLLHAPGPPSTTIAVDDAVNGVEKRLGSAILDIPVRYRSRYGDPTTRV